MKILKKVGIGFAALIAVLVIVGFILPSEYSTERSITIDAPPQVVFDQVNDLEKYNKWSPWLEADPSMKITYGDSKVGVGASYSWVGDESGEGIQTIEESVAPSKITTDLDFKEQGKGKGHWTFAPAGEGTEVTWGMSGDAGMNIIGRYFGLFIDGLVGEMFEKGLANLKKQAEAAASAEA